MTDNKNKPMAAVTPPKAEAKPASEAPSKSAEKQEAQTPAPQPAQAATDGKPNHQGEGGGRPRAFAEIHLLEQSIENYFSKMKNEKRPTTMASLALHLKVSKETLNQYAKGTYDTETEKFSETVGNARLQIEADKLEKMLLGEYICAAAKFDLENNHGYSAKTTNEHTGAGGSPLPPIQVTFDVVYPDKKG